MTSRLLRRSPSSGAGASGLRRTWGKSCAIGCALAATGLAAAGCGSTSSSGGGGGGGGSGATVHLTYALWDPHEEIGYKRSIAKFEETHPNIKVSFDLIDYNDYESKLTTEFGSGQGPDVFWVGNGMLSTWASEGAMENILPKVKANHINLGIYYPALVAAHERGGKLYGLPKDWDTEALLYNKKYFAAHHLIMPPQLTWNPTSGGSFLKLLKEATVDSSGHNAMTAGFNPNSVTTYGIADVNTMQEWQQNYLAMDGVDVYAAPFSKKIAMGTPQGLATMKFLVDLITRDHVAVPGSELGSNAEGSDNQPETLFARQKVAMIEAGDWNLTLVRQTAKFTWSIAPIPAGPKGRISVTAGLIDAINPHSSHQAAAWDLEQWLGSTASEKILGSGGFVWPAIKADDKYFVQYWKKQGVDVGPYQTEQEQKTVYTPVSPGAVQALADIGSALGPAYLGQSSVNAAMSNAVSVGDRDSNAAASSNG